MTWLASIAAVVIILVGAGIWRLMSGPVALNFLLPAVQAAFARTGLEVAMSGVSLAIDGATHQLDLNIENARLSLPDGEKLGDFPQLATGFTLGPLLRGRLVPSRITIERPVVRLLRDPAGRISFDLGNAATAGHGAAIGVGPAMAEAPLGVLDRLQVGDATVVVDDRMLGRRWQVDHLDALIARGASGTGGRLSLALSLGDGRTAKFDATFRYRAAQRTLDFALAANRVEPAILASLAPVLAPLADLHLPVSGVVHTRFDFAASRFGPLQLDLALGGGWIATREFANGRLALTGGTLHAVYTPQSGLLRIGRLVLDLGGGTRLVADGQVAGLVPGAPGVGRSPARIALDLTRVPIAKFAALWPLGLSPHGRAWVLANLRAGILDEATVLLDLALNPAHGSAKVTQARGTLRYRDVAVNYMTGLPLARNIAGTATLTEKELEFAPSGGSVKGLKLGGGSVRIADLNTPVPILTADLALAGPLRDALDILDTRPLGVAGAIGLDPAAIGGHVETRLHLQLPVVAGLKPIDIDYSGTATLGKVTISRVAFGHDLTGGDFAVTYARSGVRATGAARFAGTPATIDTALSFGGKAGVSAISRVAMTLNDRARQRIGCDLAPRILSGPVAAELTYSVEGGGHRSAAIALDLRAARLAVAEAGWEKPAGQPGTARIDVDLAHRALAGAIRIAVQAKGLDGRFAVVPVPGGTQIARVDIGRLVVGGDDFSGTVTRRGKGWHAAVDGRRVDLQPVLSRTLADDTNTATPLTISARLDQVAFGPGRILHGVTATLSRAGGAWRSMRIDGSYANGRALSFRLDGGGAGPARLDITSNDFGSALRLLAVADNVDGGSMTVTGRLADIGGTPAVQAQIAAADFSVVRAPIATRILSLPSLAGLSSMLSGSGIPFSTLRARFTYSAGQVALDRLNVYGDALGVTARGAVDPARRTLNLAGTIAPAHGLNSMLGKVPVIGALLMGGKGESLFAAYYQLSGAIDDPAVSVDPFSAIAPGFLRRLFDPDLFAEPQ